MSGPVVAPSALARIAAWPHSCDEEVSREGESQPCEKPAVAVRCDSTEGDHPYPVCAYHARGKMIPLASLLGVGRKPLHEEIAALAEDDGAVDGACEAMDAEHDKVQHIHASECCWVGYGAYARAVLRGLAAHVEGGKP